MRLQACFAPAVRPRPRRDLANVLFAVLSINVDRAGHCRRVAAAGSARRGPATPPDPPRSSLRTLRDELTGYAMSFMLHLAAMAALMLTVIVHVEPGRRVPLTVSTELPSDAPLETATFDIVKAEPVGENTLAIGPVALAGERAENSPVLPSLQAALGPAGAAGTGTATGSPRPGGAFLELPQNAVQAGSFAAWWIPKQERYGEVVEPGQLPREGQDYRIYVQIAVPEGRRTYKVDDLSGEIVGTDGYKQLIPALAFVADGEGNLVRAAGARSYLPVRNGVAEIIFKVQAAGKAGVQDTIRIRSRLLGEEQLLTLVFQPLPPPASE